MIDALHYLSFVAGDKSQLEILDGDRRVHRDLFTPDSLKALDEAYLAATEDLLDDEEVLEADITLERWMRRMTPFSKRSTAQTSPS